MDPDREVEELDLEDKMHDGIFAGAKRFNQTQVHSCQLCGFQAHNPAYFCVVDCCGVPPEKSQQSTDDFMVNQLSEKNDFLGSKLSQKQPQTYSFCKLISFFG